MDFFLYNVVSFTSVNDYIFGVIDLLYCKSGQLFVLMSDCICRKYFMNNKGIQS